MKGLGSLPKAPVMIAAVISFGTMLPIVGSAQKSPVPAIDGKTLSGEAVRLLDGKSDKPVVLIFGFGRSAKDQGVTWGKELVTLQQEKADFDFYQVTTLAGAPRFARGFITRAIRAEVPEAYHSHFLLLPDDARRWRELLKVTDEGSAYVALCSPTGELKWRAQGVGREQMDALRAKLRSEPD